MTESRPRATAGWRGRTVLVGLLAVLLVGAAALTLGPLPVTTLDAVVSLLQRLLPVPVSRGAVERLGNVLLFLPLGLLAALLRPRARPVLLVGLLGAVSLGVELTQSLLLPDRHPGARDVLLNTIGAALGVGLASWRLPVRRPRA